MSERERDEDGTAAAERCDRDEERGRMERGRMVEDVAPAASR